MSFTKTVAALAIVFAAQSFGVHTTFAEAAPSTQKAAAQAEAPKKTDQPVTVTVSQGDTLSSIADAHNTTWVRIYDANDGIANPDVINAGDTFRIPTDSEQLPDRYGALAAQAPVVAQPVAVAAPAAHTARTVSATSAPAASGRVATGNVGNRYAWGNCTWYVYNRKPNIGSFWGNGGYGWLGAAQAAGFSTGSAPAAGAIGVEAGHVVIVESVNGDGTINISEMNYAGGLGQIHYRTTPASEFSYIYA